MANGTKEQKQMAQDALNRFWEPALMMFGPSDKQSVHSEQNMKWKIKISSNDELRQKFVDETVPQAKFLKLKIPDEKIKWNKKTKHYNFSQPNWDEFYEVLKGNGPCNVERIETRKKAWEDGKWVRDAMVAHAQKHKNKNAKDKNAENKNE